MSEDYNWAKDVADVIRGLGSATEGALHHGAQMAASKQELDQVKRRRKAEMLSKAFKRRQGLHQMERQSGAEAAGDQAQGFQDLARGFVDALKGSYYGR